MMVDRRQRQMYIRDRVLFTRLPSARHLRTLRRVPKALERRCRADAWATFSQYHRTPRIGARSAPARSPCTSRISLHLVPRAEDRELADVRGRDPRALLRCSCPSLEGRGIRTRAQAGLQVALCSYIVRKVHVHMCIVYGFTTEANLWIYMELHRCLLSRCWVTPLCGF